MIHFPGQKEGEEVLSVIHKHPIVHVKIIFVFLFFVVFPLAISLYFWFFFYPLDSYFRWGIVAGIVASIYLLYGLLFTYIRLTNEEFDVFILTSERLIDITQISFFSRSVSSAPLEQIQDTTGTISGFFPTLLHYGSVTVKTSSAEGNILAMDHVADPNGVGHRILDQARQKKNRLIDSSTPKSA